MVHSNPFHHDRDQSLIAHPGVGTRSRVLEKYRARWTERQQARDACHDSLRCRWFSVAVLRAASKDQGETRDAHYKGGNASSHVAETQDAGGQQECRDGALRRSSAGGDQARQKTQADETHEGLQPATPGFKEETRGIEAWSQRALGRLKPRFREPRGPSPRSHHRPEAGATNGGQALPLRGRTGPN